MREGFFSSGDVAGGASTAVTSAVGLAASAGGVVRVTGAAGDETDDWGDWGLGLAEGGGFAGGVERTSDVAGLCVGAVLAAGGGAGFGTGFSTGAGICRAGPELEGVAAGGDGCCGTMVILRSRFS